MRSIITAECTLPPFFEKYIFRRKPSAEDTGMRALCLRGKGEEEPGVFYVLLNALLCAGLVWCPYQFLVEVTMLLMVVMTYPFLFAFVLLRISQPDVPRPFKVPGGTIAAVLWTLPPGLLGTAYLCQRHNPPQYPTQSPTQLIPSRDGNSVETVLKLFLAHFFSDFRGSWCIGTVSSNEPNIEGNGRETQAGRIFPPIRWLVLDAKKRKNHSSDL